MNTRRATMKAAGIQRAGNGLRGAVLFIGFVLFPEQIPARNMNVLVLPFQNLGAPKDADLSGALTDSVIADLSKVHELSVIADLDRRKLLREQALGQTGILDPDTSKRIGLMLGADVIFTGSYQVSSEDRIRVTARLVDVETGKINKSVNLDGIRSKLFELEDRIVFTLLAEVQKIGLADIRPPIISELERNSIENRTDIKDAARQLFAKGSELEDFKPAEAYKFYKQRDSK